MNLIVYRFKIFYIVNRFVVGILEKEIIFRKEMLMAWL